MSPKMKKIDIHSKGKGKEIVKGNANNHNDVFTEADLLTPDQRMNRLLEDTKALLEATKEELSAKPDKTKWNRYSAVLSTLFNILHTNIINQEVELLTNFGEKNTNKDKGIEISGEIREGNIRIILIGTDGKEVTFGKISQQTSIPFIKLTNNKKTTLNFFFSEDDVNFSLRKKHNNNGTNEADKGKNFIAAFSELEKIVDHLIENRKENIETKPDREPTRSTTSKPDAISLR
jgi:hypothetical protein